MLFFVRSFLSVLTILFLVIVANTNFVFAQVPDILIKSSNESPREGESVKLALDSSKYNLNNANITWYVDGNEMDQGVGRKTFNVLMTNQNPVQVVTVTVTEEGLNEGQAQIILEISGEILLYEGYNSSVPLFYKGRSLPGREGSVNVQLLSFKDGEITDFKPSQYSNTLYTWKINGEEKQELSGTHKPQNILNSRVVDNSLRVEILKQTETSGKTTQINIPLQQPEILLYRESDNKLSKTYQKETEVGKEINMIVEPFFFTTNNKYSDDLKYTWKINGLENSISTPWYVTFSGSRAEIVKLEVTLVNTRKITQTVSKAFNYRVE